MSKVLQVLQHDSWAVAEGTNGDDVFVLRFRTPIIRAGEGGSHPQCLTVVWPYAENGSGAMPDADADEAMSSFENRLIEAWEAGGVAFLAVVLTFDGARQWVFYTNDVDTCAQRLNDMPQEEEPYPIELAADEDPDWDYARDQIISLVDWEADQADWEASMAAE